MFSTQLSMQMLHGSKLSQPSVAVTQLIPGLMHAHWVQSLLTKRGVQLTSFPKVHNKAQKAKLDQMGSLFRLNQGEPVSEAEAQVLVELCSCCFYFHMEHLDTWSTHSVLSDQG